MKRIILPVSLFLALPLIAQTASQTTSAKPPSITDAQRAQFFKAQSQMIQANAQAQQRQTDFQAAIAEMQKTCGDTAILYVNQFGNPECVAKPIPTTK